MSEAARYAIPGGRHRVEHVIERSRLICTEIVEQDFGVQLRYALKLPAAHSPAFMAALADATRGSAVVEPVTA